MHISGRQPLEASLICFVAAQSVLSRTDQVSLLQSFARLSLLYIYLYLYICTFAK